MTGIVLCTLDQLEDPGSRGVELSDGMASEPMSILGVRMDGRVFAYQNRCTHTGVGLEWLPHQFLDTENRFIQCATHGALFRPEDGYCVRGPCAGDSLLGLPVRVCGNEVLLDT